MHKVGDNMTLPQALYCLPAGSQVRTTPQTINVTGNLYDTTRDLEKYGEETVVEIVSLPPYEPHFGDTVETAEQLDQLPHGTVVVERHHKDERPVAMWRKKAVSVRWERIGEDDVYLATQLITRTSQTGNTLEVLWLPEQN